MTEAVKGTIITLVQWLRLAVETTGALMIALGVVMAISRFAHTFALQQPESYVEVRLTLARYLASQLSLSWARTSCRRPLRRVGTKSASRAPSR